MKAIASKFGARVVVWRYDLVVLTDHTPPAWHLANFTQLAAKLAGSVDEVTVSFSQIYQTTRRDLDRAAFKGEFRWEDPDTDTKRELIQRLGAISNTYQMRLIVCILKVLANTETPNAACINAALLSETAGSPITAKQRDNRPDCFCHASRDIGAYETVNTVVPDAMPCRTQIKRSEILQRTTRNPKACNVPVLMQSCRPNLRRQAACPQHRSSQLRPSPDAIVYRASHSLVAAPRRRYH